MKIKSIFLATAITLTGCSNIPKQNEITKLDLGMTVDQVNEILGMPKMKTIQQSSHNKMCMSYELVQYTTISRTSTVLKDVGFENGRVVSIGKC